MATANAKHVLVGDDEFHTRLTLSLVLRKAGYRVTEASSGNEVLRKVLEFGKGQCSFDLLLIDFQMPGLTGLELATELKHRRIPWPVLIMYGHSDEELVAEAMRRGCLGYLEKPFEPEQLLRRVQWALEKATKIGNKEETMYLSSEYRGLCSTCNHAADCAHRMRAQTPILHCEEFYAYQAPAKRGEPEPGQRSAGYMDADSRDYRGLCINCESRKTCINATCERGVWHCENYH